jgi:hypothetical protein
MDGTSVLVWIAFVGLAVMGMCNKSDCWGCKARTGNPVRSLIIRLLVRLFRK